MPDKKSYTTAEKAKVAIMWLLMVGFCAMNVMVKVGFPPFMRFVPVSLPMSCCFLWLMLAIGMPYYYKST